ncbi:hypothetical protein A2U01_0067169, partial [Trifolium medium]|nr:hypothetical protein [Trifolium medium]
MKIMQPGGCGRFISLEPFSSGESCSLVLANLTVITLPLDPSGNIGT